MNKDYNRNASFSLFVLKLKLCFLDLFTECCFIREKFGHFPSVIQQHGHVMLLSTVVHGLLVRQPLWNHGPPHFYRDWKYIEVTSQTASKEMKLKPISNVMLINVNCIKLGTFSTSKLDIIFPCFPPEMCSFIGPK